MRLLVLGGTGGVGRHVLRLAAAEGHAVTALVRPTSGPAPPGVRLVHDEPLREGAIADLLPGHDAVVCSIGPRRRHVWNPWSALTSPEDLTSRVAGLLVQAMRRAGVTRAVVVSAAGVGDSAPRMNLAMRGLVATSSIGLAYRDLAVMEQVLLAADDLDITCVRPVTLTDRPPTGRVREVDRFGATLTIARADVARDLLDRVVATGRGSRTPQIAGP